MTKDQAQLLKFIFSKFSSVKNINFEDYSFSSNEEDFYTSAYVELDGLFACVSLPKNSKTNFICISDGSPSELCKITSSLQHYQEYKSRLSHGHTVPLITNEYVMNYGWYAALMLSLDLHVDGFDEELGNEFPGKNTLLAILISNSEHDIKINKGINGLLDYFDEIERDIISINNN